MNMQAIELMMETGGAFEKALANTWLRADDLNRGKLTTMFNEFKKFEVQKIKPIVFKKRTAEEVSIYFTTLLMNDYVKKEKVIGMIHKMSSTGRLGAYLNDIISDLNIMGKGQYFRDLFRKYDEEVLNAFGDLK